MKKGLWCIVLGVLAIVFTACRRDIVYSQFSPIPSEKWHVDSVAQFEYSIADIDAPYRILIYVRHTERYPYQNLWLFVSDDQKSDTIEFYLADDRGQWLGNKHHGFIEMPVLLEETKLYADTGIHRIAIQHAMRDTLLRGVTDVGVEIINGKK